ncbi:AMP-binding protein [Kaistella montana]|uniref:AMP-binding protein n=1 Tax=Kaistella montana TaxID=1849733 RepID=A0ABW5K8N5_9FLAO|nr:AMP-binding protein [Kaistella montana]MCQ4035580.1 AMP-binding protein [Kaistella montana]
MELDFSKDIQIKSLFPQTEFEEKVISFLENWFSDTKTVSVQTSGSTGVPKVFEIEKSRMQSSAKMTCDFLGLKEGDTALICLPVEYISGKMMMVRSIQRNLKLFIESPSAKPLSQLNQEIDFCAMSPLQVENSLEQLHFIKKIIIGGAQVSESLKQKIADALQNTAYETTIYETYGMSETLSHIALKQIYPVSEEYFTLFEGVEISLDERACLTIKAPQLNPEILQTNDLVELKNTQQFKFLGRFDNVINSAGLKIYPEQLEHFIKQKLSNEVVFLGLKDETYGQKLVAVIEGEETDELKSQLSPILQELSETFTKNHVPKQTFFLDKFPRLPNGKINRKELLTLF